MLPLLLVPHLFAPIAVSAHVEPAPSVTLAVDVESPQRWRVRLENTGAIPLRVIADARFASFEITAPGASKAVRCALPADMRPSDAEQRALVLPPERAYAEVIDPRMYCFGAKEEAAMVPGAQVIAKLGFEPGRARVHHGPFEVEPIEGVTPLVGPQKEVVSARWTIPAPPAPPPPSAAPAPAPTAARADVEDTLELTAAPRVDAGRGLDASLTLTIANRGAHAVTTLVRPETLAFDVLGPDGPVRCSGVRPVDAPIRELYTTIPAHGHITLPVTLSAVCPDTTFDQTGMYTVRPELDTRHASGSPIGLRTFDGVLIARESSRVRVRHPRKPEVLRRPTLEQPAETSLLTPTEPRACARREDC